MATGNFVVRLSLAAVVLGGTAAGLAIYGMKQRAAAATEGATLAQYQAAAERSPLTISGQATAAEGEIQRAVARGRFDPARQVLVPHQLADGREGYDVWISLLYSNGFNNNTGELIVVNRGWIAAEATVDPAVFQVPTDEVEVQGFWLPLPMEATGDLELANCIDPTWPKTYTKVLPSFADIKCLYNSQQIAQGVVQLNTDFGSGLQHDWLEQQSARAQRLRLMSRIGFGGAAVAILALLAFAVFGRPRKSSAAPLPPAAAATPHAPERHPRAPLGKASIGKPPH